MATNFEALRHMEPDAITPEEAAAALQVSVATLASWRSLGKGPAFYRTGRTVYYLAPDVRAWLARQRVEVIDRERQQQRNPPGAIRTGRGMQNTSGHRLGGRPVKSKHGVVEVYRV